MVHQFAKCKARRVLATPANLAGLKLEVREVAAREIIYSQGDLGQNVIYIQKGAVKLCARTQADHEVVVAILGPGHFIGEKCLSGWMVRLTTAIATAPCTLFVIPKSEMRRVLRTKHPFCDVFISYLLARNLQVEEDLIYNLCSSAEMRLARLLLRLAERGDHDAVHAFAKITQETLARMIGTTRSRVNTFLMRFRKRGLIRYTGKHDGVLKRMYELRVNTTRLAALVNEYPSTNVPRAPVHATIPRFR